MPKLSNKTWNDFPEVVAQYHPTKNGDKKLEDYRCKSGIKVWWLCPKGSDHEWEAKICSRTNGTKCPCCDGKKVVPSTCLLTTHPHIASSWHPTKNGKKRPEHYTAGSGKKVFWLCEKGHEWESAITDRTRPYGNGCPRCSESKGEKKTLETIESLGIYHERQFKFDNCKDKKSLPFDFLVIQNGSCGLIEYQGKQHYQPVENWGGEKELANIQSRDQIKQSFCDNVNIPLLKIPYWEYNKIPQLVTDFVQSLPQQFV